MGTGAGKASVAIETSVESIADLVLTINDPPAPAPIGSEVQYEIVVRNRGSREAKDVRTIAQFSHGIEPQRVEGQSGEVVTGQVLFDAIPRIASGRRSPHASDRTGGNRWSSSLPNGSSQRRHDTGRRRSDSLHEPTL